MGQAKYLSALYALRSRSRDIERCQEKGLHRNVPLLTTASQARQRSTGGDPLAFITSPLLARKR
jgi:hypothetical protein